MIGLHYDYDKSVPSFYFQDDETFVRACDYLRSAPILHVVGDYHKSKGTPDNTFYGACLWVKLTCYDPALLTRRHARFLMALFVDVIKHMKGERVFMSKEWSTFKLEHARSVEWYEMVKKRVAEAEE